MISDIFKDHALPNVGLRECLLYASLYTVAELLIFLRKLPVYVHGNVKV